MSFGARALIRLSALQHNFNVIQGRVPGAKVMAVIKANAYGHDMIAVARGLPDADAFAVARMPEAIELRENGIDTPIVVFAGVRDAKELRLADHWKLQPVVHCAEQISLLESHSSGSLSVWLKFDTGMHRMGLLPGAAGSLLSQLNSMASVAKVGLMTHLSSADELENEVTAGQFGKFHELIAETQTAVSIGNSAAIFGWPDLLANLPGSQREHWIRPGIALFGISPFADRIGEDLGLRAVMQLEARLIAVKPLSSGAFVGYKRAYKSVTDTVLGVISVGYGDGYSRHFRSGTPVLINGRRVPVVGNVSMDTITVDLGVAAVDRVGDKATLWGDGLPAEEVAPWANAIPYELVCGVLNREASQLAK